jgi:hypothetical protein
MKFNTMNLNYIMEQLCQQQINPCDTQMFMANRKYNYFELLFLPKPSMQEHKYQM